MEKKTSDCSAQIDKLFYGSVTVGERGQVVIPAKARRDFQIECGDQLLIMGHPEKHGLMVMKVEAIRTFLSKMIEDLKYIESQQSIPPPAEASDIQPTDLDSTTNAQEAD
jgi:AbrB family looped-hinge helix DNA binding protein